MLADVRQRQHRPRRPLLCRRGLLHPRGHRRNCEPRPIRRRQRHARGGIQRVRELHMRRHLSREEKGVADIGGLASGAVRTGVEEGGDGGEGRSGVHLLGHI